MSAAVPLLGVGTVRHERLRPAPHRFAYPTYFVLLPLRALRAAPSAALPRNRFGLVGFADRDHGDGRADCLEWLDALLAAHGIAAEGEVWLQCYPRVLGYAFKPVSFWYCHRADGTLAAIVAEVNNTFGERHCYLLDAPGLGFGRELDAPKVFHVSPFCAVAGSYRFRFARRGVHPEPGGVRTDGWMTSHRTIACVDHLDAHGPLIRTSIAGALQPLTPARARAVFFGMPLMTLAVIARIHWQALRLWLKRVPFFHKPAPPPTFTTR